MKAFKFLAFLTLLSLAACEETSNQKEKQKDSTAATSSPGDTMASATGGKGLPVSFDHKYDNTSSFIAGIQPESGMDVGNYDTTANWKKFAANFDSIWTILDQNRLSKMKEWKKKELAAVSPHVKSLFYPFSGPDYLNADMFFSEADTFRMIGLEPVGKLPEISQMKLPAVRTYLNSVNTSLNDIFRRSYFITMNMLNDLGKNKANGTLPVICVFLKRTNHTITNIEYVGVDSIGNIVPRNDTIPFKGSAGVKVEFFAKGSNQLKTLYYFKTDLSDQGMKSNKGFTAYLQSMGPQATYLKAASHLLHYGTFSTIRNIILDKSIAVLQDDSGISYKFFDKKIWDVKLYGNYRKAVKDFKGVDQPDLKKAYESDSTVQTLPFTLGYHWGSDEINLQLATRKK